MPQLAQTFRWYAAFGFAIAFLAASSTARGLALQSPPVLGRWAITVQGRDGEYPSWLEVTEANGQLTARFQPRSGSVRPVKSVMFSDGLLVFTMPGRQQTEQRYEARLENGMLSGKLTGAPGGELTWKARRTPDLKRGAAPQWGEPVDLFNGKNLDGWRPQHSGRPNGWEAQDGGLVNARPGNNLVSEAKFTDFKLHAEFRYPKGSNSGIYLRGRYEMQIEDNFGQVAHKNSLGSIYGYLAPTVNAAKPAGEWQICDITLVGRMVTIELNGQKIVDNQEIPGITGGALDNDEAAPGPIYLQGDHGAVEFRNLKITPAKGGSAGV